MKIITLTPSPAVDIHLSSDTFALGEYNKVKIISRDSGGKGINLSRALCENGINNIAAAFIGKDGAESFLSPLLSRGMNMLVTYTEGSVRENINIQHKDCETVIATPGSPIGKAELSDMEEKLLPLVDGDTVLAFCGSISDGSDKGGILSLLYKCKALGASIVFDTKSLSLEEILPLKPYLIKPNESEAEMLTGMTVSSLDDAIRASLALRDMGCENVMLTLGGSGAVLAAPDGVYTVSSPRVEVVSTVGAGDSSIAGFLAAKREGLDSPSALEYAVAYGSAACMSFGSLPPIKENVESILNTQKGSSVRREL